MLLQTIYKFETLDHNCATAWECAAMAIAGYKQLNHNKSNLKNDKTNKFNM